MPLVEVGVRVRLRGQLLDLVGVNMEHKALVGLLVRSGESAEDEDLVLASRVETATLKANPVGILFNLQVEDLPLHFDLLQIQLLNQVCALATIEPSHNIEEAVVERNG